MTKIILSLSFILWVTATFSQQTTGGLIGLSVGPSLPLADFADTDGYNANAGFAKTGIHFNVHFSYKFNENFGIAALWTGNAHPIDTGEMIDIFRTSDPSLNWQLETQPWSSGAFLSGLLVSLPFNKVDFDIKALIGISSSTMPGIDVTASNGGSSVNISQQEASSMALALNFGAGLRYNLSEKWALTVNMDYFTTKPSFEVVTRSDFGYSSTDDIGQTMNMMNVSFGVGYRLK